ncbi:thioredoxin family protein [Azorhizobium sp. AG788]|uniref:thioredoxin family protein n=1 Tax=Azorhizobium sp. AG788 TaxID=2183897 RepID=UPI00313A03B1
MPFLTRRRFVALSLGTAAAAATRPAHAATIEPYTAVAFEAANKLDAPVYLHVYAPWCLQCFTQDTILQKLLAEPKFAAATFLRVSYDDQENVVAALNVPRATLIAYRRGRETGRLSWSVAPDEIQKVLLSALPVVPQRPG